MIKLNDLHFNEGSMKSKKRVARGNSGKSSGRGLKGQKARSGVRMGNFQGGQTPIERRMPKQIPFYTRPGFIGLPLSYIELCIEHKLLDANQITLDSLKQVGLIKKGEKHKLIGACTQKLVIEAFSASQGAVASIQSFGGELRIIK